MAQFDITIERLSSEEAWPDCCARCGNAGTALVPVPARYAKKTDGFSVPLCPKHETDWTSVRFRTRIGALLLLLCVPVTLSLAWALQPHVARPHEQNDAARYSFAIAFGLFALMPIGGLLVWWAKVPIRVIGVAGRIVTVAGVCRTFKRAMAPKDEPAIPAVSEEARFDVQPYAPNPVVPMNRAANALAILFVLAAILGSAIGIGGVEIEQQAAGWDKNDWRYIPMTIGVVLAFVLPVLSPRLLFSRFAFVIAIFLSLLVLIGLGVARIAGSMKVGFSIAYTVTALILIQFLAQRLIWRWKLRSTVIAVAAGAGSALTFTAFVLMLGGLSPGPHLAAYGFGPVFAIVAALLSRAAATAPFCSECDDWLTERRIGALPKSLAEVQPLIAGRQVIALANVKPYEKSASIGDVELKVFTCERCRESGSVVLELFDCIKGGKNGKQPIVTRIGRWLYPGAALPVLEAMYPPPQPLEVSGVTV